MTSIIPKYCIIFRQSFACSETPTWELLLYFLHSYDDDMYHLAFLRFECIIRGKFASAIMAHV
jgi:hypothetical protein